MENKEYQNVCMGGVCGDRRQEERRGMCSEGNRGCQNMCGMLCGGRHTMVRWILGIIILAFVFGAGIKLGEFKERVRGSGYGYGMMNRNTYEMPGRYTMMQRQVDADTYYGGGMMRELNSVNPTALPR